MVITIHLENTHSHLTTSAVCTVQTQQAKFIINVAYTGWGRKYDLGGLGWTETSGVADNLTSHFQVPGTAEQ